MQLETISIPAATFLMGSGNGSDDEKPVHKVSLAPYQIGRFPITNRQFKEFAANHSPQSGFDHPDQPVTGVSWFDAVAYCDWLSEKTGEKYRLPTEAEWEFAATAGNPKNIYPWGTRSWNERPELHQRFLNGPEVIGSFEPNEFGIHDLGINVHEWCSDWYDSAYYALSPFENPTGPLQGTRKSSRGGSWRHQIKITRCAARSSIPPGMKYADYGFRVAVSRLGV
jgi:formylglycine-generating enzyme required for sulfatase activity